MSQYFHKLPFKLRLALATIAYVGVASFIGLWIGLVFDMVYSYQTTTPFQLTGTIIIGMACAIIAFHECMSKKWKNIW